MECRIRFYPPCIYYRENSAIGAIFVKISDKQLKSATLTVLHDFAEGKYDIMVVVRNGFI